MVDMVRVMSSFLSVEVSFYTFIGRVHLLHLLTVYRKHLIFLRVSCLLAYLVAFGESVIKHLAN